MTSLFKSSIISDDDLSEAIAAQQRILLPMSREDMSFSYRRTLSLLSPSPMVISHALFQEMAIIHAALDKAVHALVRQWPEDPELQRLISVPPFIASLLRPRPGSPPYRPGTVRPDLLFDVAGHLHVCEINARFPLNGYLLSAKYAEGLLRECLDHRSVLARLNVSPIGPNLDFFQALRARLVGDESDPVVFHLRGREKMHDTAMVSSALNVPVRQAPPAQLAVNTEPDRSLCFREADGSLTPIKSALLELHQDELLALPEDVMRAMADLSHSGRMLNDIRTVFLVHDKAFLHAITHDMLDLDDETQAVLRRHVIPTIKFQKSAILEEPFGPGVSRVLKPALSGKAAGIVMEKNISPEDFNMVLQRLPDDVPFILQPYLTQLKLEVLTLDGKARFLRTVGLLLGLDGDFFGPGIFRCNDGDLISLTGGGVPLMPARELIEMPPDSRFYCESLGTADTGAINRALRDHGIALVGTMDDMGDKIALERFLSEGLGGQCRTHSDSQGAVWDVRPTQGWTAQEARSHTTLPFEIHTDASFEKNPPRFVAMAVVRSDRCGGGQLSVIRIADAVAELSEEDVETLLTARPRWIVPPEFFKSGVEEVRAPVLMSRERARFRCDKLCTKHMEEAEARRFREAFASFTKALERGCERQAMVVPDKTMIIVDNQRFAHSRSHVMDMKRHLLRVRFDLAHVSIDM